MANKNFILKADDYKYPSLVERKLVLKDYPKLTSFGFKYKSELESLINEKLPVIEAMNIGHLYYWDNCLLNRFGILQETFIYTLTNYNRGFNDDYTKCQKIEILNRILFDYYAEIFYYYFFSTRDIIAQIIRLYYNIKIKENQLLFNSKLIEKIIEKKVRNSSTTFLKETNGAYKFRNKFAHNFTPTLNDYRTILNESNGRMSLNIGGYTSIESKKIVESIKNSLNSLSMYPSDQVGLRFP